jgi:hypothetical protein
MRIFNKPIAFIFDALYILSLIFKEYVQYENKSDTNS